MNKAIGDYLLQNRVFVRIVLFLIVPLFTLAIAGGGNIFAGIVKIQGLLATAQGPQRTTLITAIVSTAIFPGAILLIIFSELLARLEAGKKD